MNVLVEDSPVLQVKVVHLIQVQGKRPASVILVAALLNPIVFNVTVQQLTLVTILSP
jgi:hypothetical protein